MNHRDILKLHAQREDCKEKKYEDQGPGKNHRGDRIIHRIAISFISLSFSSMSCCQSCSPILGGPTMKRGREKRFIYSNDEPLSPGSSARTPASYARQVSIATTVASVSTDAGEEFSTEEIEGLPAFTRDLLTRASCIGSYFDDYVMKQVLFLPCVEDEIARTPSFRRRSRFAKAIADAEDRGIVERAGPLGYQFRRSSLSRAFYDRLPRETREEVHLEIGRVMKKGLRRRSGGRHSFCLNRQGGNNGCKLFNCSPTEMTKFVQRYFENAAEQLERGKGLVSTQEELVEISSLNERAAALSFGGKSNRRRVTCAASDVGAMRRERKGSLRGLLRMRTG